MVRRRLAAAVAPAALTAALLTDDMSPPASRKSKVRLIQAIPGEEAVDVVSGGDVVVANARFPSASDYQEVPAGSRDVEVRKAGSGEVLAKTDNLKLASGSISSPAAVGGIGEKVELLDIPAAAAVSAAGGVATGAGGSSPDPHRGGRRFALFLLIGGGLVAAAGFVVQRWRSTG